MPIALYRPVIETPAKPLALSPEVIPVLLFSGIGLLVGLCSVMFGIDMTPAYF